MNGLWKRVCGRINKTVKDFQSDLHFSPYYAFLRVGSELGGRLHLNEFSQRSTEKKHRWSEAYLDKLLAPMISRYEQDTDVGQYEPNAPIWVCWWTGEETAPALVKRCLESIRKNANGHPVHLITRENYLQYLDIPDCILDKLNNGTMCVANFSDYLRFSLLAQYGGWWLDATIYCTQQLPESIFKMSLFTCKGRTGPSNYYSDYRWTSFCIGSYRGNIATRFLKEAFEIYWSKNTVSIDYLLVDYLIGLVYRKNAMVRDLLDQLPENNLHRDDLQAAMNAALPAEEFENVIQPDTVLYKLSWREKYETLTPDGKKTVYGAFINAPLEGK
jgi:hypothetical protein